MAEYCAMTYFLVQCNRNPLMVFLLLLHLQNLFQTSIIPFLVKERNITSSSKVMAVINVQQPQRRLLNDICCSLVFLNIFRCKHQILSHYTLRVLNRNKQTITTTKIQNVYGRFIVPSNISFIL